MKRSQTLVINILETIDAHLFATACIDLQVGLSSNEELKSKTTSIVIFKNRWWNASEDKYNQIFISANFNCLKLVHFTLATSIYPRFFN